MARRERDGAVCHADIEGNNEWEGRGWRGGRGMVQFVIPLNNEWEGRGGGGSG